MIELFNKKGKPHYLLISTLLGIGSFFVAGLLFNFIFWLFSIYQAFPLNPYQPLQNLLFLFPGIVAGRLLSVLFGKPVSLSISFGLGLGFFLPFMQALILSYRYGQITVNSTMLMNIGIMSMLMGMIITLPFNNFIKSIKTIFFIVIGFLFAFLFIHFIKSNDSIFLLLRPLIHIIESLPIQNENAWNLFGDGSLVFIFFTSIGGAFTGFAMAYSKLGITTK